jgi:carbon-monoxide dehydrogenase medium subunit
MKPAPFDYYAPRTIEEACKLLAEAGGGATVLAGGQTLMPLLALRMSQPFILVDINKIDALKGVTRVTDSAEGRVEGRVRGCDASVARVAMDGYPGLARSRDSVAQCPQGEAHEAPSNSATRVGPVVRQNEVIADETLRRCLPVLVTATSHVGHHQTRNRGTIGGSIALGEPAAELPATAAALGASIEVCSVRGTRRVRADEMYLAPYATALEPDELITAIEFPDWPSHAVPLFREVARRPGDFALVGLVGALAVESGRISRAGIAWFGMGPTPMKARQAEAALTGQSVASLDVQGIAELAVADTAPFDDRHASAEYRRIVGRRIFARALGEALNVRQAA